MQLYRDGDFAVRFRKGFECVIKAINEGTGNSYTEEDIANIIIQKYRNRLCTHNLQKGIRFIDEFITMDELDIQVINGIVVESEEGDEYIYSKYYNSSRLTETKRFRNSESYPVMIEEETDSFAGVQAVFDIETPKKWRKVIVEDIKQQWKDHFMGIFSYEDYSTVEMTENGVTLTADVFHKYVFEPGRGELLFLKLGEIERRNYVQNRNGSTGND